VLTANTQANRPEIATARILCHEPKPQPAPATRLQAAVGEVHQVRRPGLEAVEDVRRVDDAGAALFGLGAQVRQQVGAAQHVQVHRDFVQEQHLHPVAAVATFKGYV